MAKFTFSLETVLRQRENNEHIAQRDAAAAQQMLVELQLKLQKLDRDATAVGKDMRENHLVGPINVSVLTSHRRYMLAMERTVIELARNIAEAQAKVDKTRHALIASAKERKVIQALKDKQKSQWQDEQNRLENALSDEAGMQIAFSNLVDNRQGSGNPA